MFSTVLTSRALRKHSELSGDFKNFTKNGSLSFLDIFKLSKQGNQKQKHIMHHAICLRNLLFFLHRQERLRIGILASPVNSSTPFVRIAGKWAKSKKKDNLQVGGRTQCPAVQNTLRAFTTGALSALNQWTIHCI